MPTVNKKELKNSQIELTISISFEELSPIKNSVIITSAKDLDLPGFRKGKAPQNLVVEHIGMDNIMQKTAEEALKKYYPEIVAKEKVEAIGRPEIVITKIADGNPLEVKATVTVLPTFTLPDFKKIACNINKEKLDTMKVEDSEVEKVITEIQKNREMMVNQGKKEDEKKETITIDDNFAKSIGDFKDLSDLRAKIKDNLLEEKNMKQKDSRRLKIIDAILEKIKIETPDLLVENELDKMIADLDGRVAGSGIPFDKYLEHIKKTKEDLRSEWKKDAEKRVRINLVLQKIAKEEKIEVDKNAIDEEVKHIKESYPEADEERARHYVEGLLTYQKTYELLENEK
tara:strand:- start:6699 stop:7727 length:1029 start_codon:yes stop_codon:yes gene_type:complete